MSLLAIDGLVAGYVPGVNILDGVSLRVEPGSITGIIGANGAGKSTLLKTVFGLLAPVIGSIRFDGRDVAGLLPAELKRLDISYFPQGSNIFPHMTVEENLRLSCWTFRRDTARVAKALARAQELFPVLGTKRDSKASLLSGGEAKMLSLAREILSAPRLMLVDEPSAGLAPKVTDYVYEFLAQCRKEEATILLVDQNIRASVRASDYVYVFDTGKVKLEGPRERFAGDVQRIVRDVLFGD
jgi:ABC-type branched-subunit amino acid transport system ATPase component